MKKYIALLLVSLVSLGLPLTAIQTRNELTTSIDDSAAVTNNESIVIIDAQTGAMIYSKNPDRVLPPASLTKIITLHIVYNEIAAGRLRRDELVTINENDAMPKMPRGSSLMYLRKGMRVSIEDLMLGAAVVSGNDAAYSLARRVAGSNDAFAQRMNAEVQRLGFSKMHFVEPSGISEYNRITAREYAYFVKRYLEMHPESLAELHSVKSISFPRAEHATEGYVPRGKTIQTNKNAIIFSYPGADGLKTGYIVEVGYNLAATAKRGNTRFILVSLGGKGQGNHGINNRERSGAALLDWAFNNYETINPPIKQAIPSVRVYYGTKSAIAVIPEGNLGVTVPKNLRSDQAVRISVEIPHSVDAPIKKGQVIGNLIYSAGDTELRRLNLVAADDVPLGNFLSRLRDRISRFFEN